MNCTNMNFEMLTDEIKRIEGIVTPLPIDKDANIRALLEGASKKHPAIRRAIEGKTSITEFVGGYAEDLEGLGLFKRLKLKCKYDSCLLNFIDEVLWVKGYKSTGRAGGYYISITRGPDGLPYVGGSLAVLFGLLMIAFIPLLFVAADWIPGLVFLGLSVIWWAGTYATWFYGPFEYTRELVPVLRNKAEYLDAVIRRCYPINK